MTMDEIKALIDAMAASDLAEMNLVKDGWTLRLSRHASAPTLPHSAAPPRPDRARRPATAIGDQAQANEVRAPLQGIAYLSPAPNASTFVTVGQAVEAGALLCTIEAMKTFNEVRAERAGTVEAVLFASGDEVLAGQPLLRLV